jgi:hypothetical protein
MSIGSPAFELIRDNFRTFDVRMRMRSPLPLTKTLEVLMWSRFRGGRVPVQPILQDNADTATPREFPNVNGNKFKMIGTKWRRLEHGAQLLAEGGVVHNPAITWGCRVPPPVVFPADFLERGLRLRESHHHIH